MWGALPSALAIKTPGKAKLQVYLYSSLLHLERNKSFDYYMEPHNLQPCNCMLCQWLLQELNSVSAINPKLKNQCWCRKKPERCCILTCSVLENYTELWAVHLCQDGRAMGRWMGQIWRPCRNGRICPWCCELCHRFGLRFVKGLKIWCSLHSDKLTQTAVKALEYVCSCYVLYIIHPFPLDMRGCHFQLRMHEWEQGRKDKSCAKQHPSVF